jgi:hypothetical protein
MLANSKTVVMARLMTWKPRYSTIPIRSMGVSLGCRQGVAADVLKSGIYDIGDIRL